MIDLILSGQMGLLNSNQMSSYKRRIDSFVEDYYLINKQSLMLCLNFFPLYLNSRVSDLYRKNDSLISSEI